MPATAGRYELLEHTADVGVVAHGPTLAETFAGAAEGMYALMVEPGDVRPSEPREIRLSAPDRERLLVAWLLELLFLTESQQLLFRRFEVEQAGISRNVARMRPIAVIKG